MDSQEFRILAKIADELHTMNKVLGHIAQAPIFNDRNNYKGYNGNQNPEKTKEE